MRDYPMVNHSHQMPFPLLPLPKHIEMKTLILPGRRGPFCRSSGGYPEESGRVTRSRLCMGSIEFPESRLILLILNLPPNCQREQIPRIRDPPGLLQVNVSERVVFLDRRSDAV